MATREFIVGTRQQKDWGWLLILDLFFGGIGAGLTFYALILGSVLGIGAGVGLVLVGGLFLLGDLSHPEKAWRLFSQPQRSWISRGIIGILIFVVLALVYIVYLVIGENEWASVGAPWLAGPQWLKVLGVLVGIGALFIAIYPGFLLGNMRPISFWNGAYIPALFLVSALLGGLGSVYLLPLNWDHIGWALPLLENLGAGLIIFELLLLMGLAWLVHPQTTRNSVRLFTHGPLRFHFFMGLLGLGLIGPLVILGFIYAGATIQPLFISEGVLLLVGAFFLRYVMLKAGVYVSPVEPVSAFV